MAQFDFGTIDPFAIGGVTLTAWLNQWRDAVHSMHRGPARPDYAVPGMMWINDSGGPAAWRVMVYLGAPGDKALFQYDTTTGTTYLLPDQMIAGTIVQAPTMQWFMSGNAADQKFWRAYPAGDGTLRMEAISDAGILQAGITLGRDGTMALAAPPAADNSALVPTTAWVRGALDAGAAGAWNVGDVRLTYRQTPASGWLFLDDTTIGNDASVAAHVGAAYQNLYSVLWPIPDVTLMTSAGAAAAKGADAATDWAANKRLILAKVLGRALGIAGAGAGLTARNLAAVVGVENQTSGTASYGVGTGPPPGGWTLTDPGHTHAVNVMQPTAFLKAEIKL